LLKKLEKYKYYRRVINIMGYAARRVESFIEDHSDEVYFSEIARECNVPKYFVRDIVRRLADEGKVRDCSREQVDGQPCCEWTGA
jgi:hypothetical protein